MTENRATEQSEKLSDMKKLQSRQSLKKLTQLDKNKR